jgi:hypothetical protein
MLCVFRAALKRPHVIWWDNFNRAYAVAMQRLDKSAHNLCNWTGIGARAVHTTIDVSHIDLRLHSHASQQAFPQDFLEPARWKTLNEQLIKMTSPASVQKFSKTNWCVKFVVNRVPITAKFDKTTDPVLHERATDGRTTLTNFYPIEMSAENIGSNLGLLKLLFNINKEHDETPGPEQVYKTIASDCNIFLRILKVSAQHTC